MSDSLLSAFAPSQLQLHHRRHLHPRRSLLFQTSIKIWPSISRQQKPIAIAKAYSSIQRGFSSIVDDEDDAPTSIDLVPITSEEQFNRVLAEAQQLEESIVLLWMANWCRKCIYLKPKLEKLAADYYPRIQFYCVDVNTVPQRLVNRAGITKMPTIQLWRDSEKQSEVIGGHKAWLVVDDVRRMIENED